jgi:hypothetical protein
VPGYVDLYHPRLLAILLSIIFLSMADAFLTLDALSAGGKEINPVMNVALDLGLMPFVLIKLTITGLGLGLLCMHKNFPRVKWVILFVLIGYLILIGYHFHLMQIRIP